MHADVRRQCPVVLAVVRGGLVHEHMRWSKHVYLVVHRRHLQADLSCEHDLRALVQWRPLHVSVRWHVRRTFVSRWRLHLHRSGVHMKSIGVAVVLALSLSTASAFGSEARDAYERGTAAFKARDYGTAAREFARADELSPSPVALRAALDAAVKADDPVLGAELIDRSARAPATGDLAKSLANARLKLAHRAGKIHVSCTDCSAALDGHPLDVMRAVWASLGAHRVTVAAQGLTRDDDVNIAADATVEVQGPVADALPTPVVVVPPAPTQPTVTDTPPTMPLPLAPASTPAPLAPSSHGVGPWLFVTGAVITAGFLGVTIWSGTDTASKHTDFVDTGCRGMSPPATCDAKSSAGSGAQLRTDLLFTGTAVAGVATIIIGALFTRWSAPPVTATLSPTGGAVSVRGSF